MFRSTRFLAAAAVGVGALVALSACGSSSKTATGTSSPSGSSGSSVSAINAKVAVIGDFTSTIPFTVPEIVPTVKGVLRGFPGVQVESCDSKGTASGFLTCETKAISDHVSAVVLGFSDAAAATTLFTKAGIPVLGTTDTTSANSFPVSQSFSLYVAMGYALAKSGCTKLGIVYLDGSATYLNPLIERGFTSQGGTVAATAAIATNAPDAAPAVAKITSSGAQCVAVSLPPAQAAQALTALKQSGKPLTIAGISAVFSAQVLGALGPLTNGLLVIDSQLNLADSAPGIAQITADEHAESATAPVTQQSISAWIAARLLAAALPKVSGAVTPAALTTALNGLRNVDMDGVIPAWSSIPLDNPAYSRLFAHYGINYKIVNGKPVRDGDFYDVGPILAAK